MTSSSSSTHHSNVVPSEVGWQFVPQYYTFVNKEPHRLHCFYNKNSSFTHGTEGEEVKSCFGQQEIHKKISSIDFKDCKVFIHSVDAQSSANGGIIIQVIGEMSNSGDTWRKFVQTFFLAEQPNGYFVLNDIFRFLKEETVDDGEGSEIDASADASIAPSAPSVTANGLELPAQQAPAPPEPVYEQPRVVTPPPPVAVEDTAIEVTPPEDEAPTGTDLVPEPTQTLAPVPEQPTLTVQPNGHTPAPEASAVHSPIPVHPSPKPIPSPTLSVPSPAPAAATTTVLGAAAPPNSTATSNANPQQPRSWASLAASNSKKWGPVAQVSETVAPSSSPGSGSQIVAPTSVSPSVSQSHHGRPNQQKNDHSALSAAQSVTTAHCFVKGVTDIVTQGVLEQTLISRFGPIKELEILRNKACAFLEFQSVESARKAIIASLSQQQGGEGGVRIDVGGEQHRILIETKKDKSERGPPRLYRGGSPAGQQVNGGDNRSGTNQGGGSNFRGGRTGGRGGGRGGTQK